MNTNMWENNITQENLARLCRGGRFTTVGPDAGDLACGWVGAGRMVSPVWMSRPRMDVWELS